MSDTTFLYDDFFIPKDDPGERVIITMKGRPVPIFFKKALDLEDMSVAQAAGLKKTIKEDGSVVIAGIDEAASECALLARMIVSWPFQDAEGNPVPVIPENIATLVPEAYMQLASIMNRRVEAVNKSLIPFVKASIDPFLQESPREQASSQADFPSAPSAMRSLDGRSRKSHKSRSQRRVG